MCAASAVPDQRKQRSIKTHFSYSAVLVLWMQQFVQQQIIEELTVNSQLLKKSPSNTSVPQVFTMLKMAVWRILFTKRLTEIFVMTHLMFALVTLVTGSNMAVFHFFFQGKSAAKTKMKCVT